jgi:predicted alpha/beta hydrolase
MFVLWHVLMPAVTRMAGYFPGRKFGLPEDLPFDVALEWGRRRLRPGREQAPRVEASVLTIRPSDDPFATESAMHRVEEFFARCRFSDFPIAVAGERPLGHLGFFSKSSREGPWQVARLWLTRGSIMN